jgi:hypothetical protein
MKQYTSAPALRASANAHQNWRISGFERLLVEATFAWHLKQSLKF